MPNKTDIEILREARALRRSSAWGSVAFYNNTHTHKQVVRLLDKAIKAEAGRQ